MRTTFRIVALRVVVGVWGGAAVGQSTWIVDAAGGPGVQFLDLPTAVAAAATGDTILVHTGPFLEGATPFTTDKGLTIVGVGGQVPIYTSAAQPIVVQSLVPGRAFRMAGFACVGDGELNFAVLGCGGEVHLENLHARSPGPMFPTGAAIAISQSATVTLRDVETFGAPAVQVTQSKVVLESCRLGLSSIGVGGGECLAATQSTVFVTEPHFDPAWFPHAVALFASTLRVAGDGAAWLASGQAIGPNVPVLGDSASVLVIDPAVPVPTTPIGGPIVTGGAILAVVPVAASWLQGAAVAGQALTITSSAPPGTPLFQALGVPGRILPTTIGDLGIDASQPYAFFPPTIVSASGLVTNVATVPAGLPSGLPFATQSLLLLLPFQALSLGVPTVFVVH